MLLAQDSHTDDLLSNVSSMSNISSIGMQILFYASLLVMIMIILSSGRFFFRYCYHFIRQKYLGKMIWNEIVYSGDVSEEELAGSIEQMDNMSQIMFQTTGKIFSFINWNRPMVSLMIRKDPDDDSVHVYVGIDRKHYKESSIQGFAQGSNCSIEETEFEDIGFKSQAPMTAIVDNYTPSRFSEQPTKSSIGGVVSRIQNLSHSDGGTVLITYEPMIRTEQNLLEDHINSENSSDMMYSKVRDQVESFSGLCPSRGVIAGFSDNNNISMSESILRSTTRSIPNSGFSEDIRKYTDIQKKAGILTLFPVVILSVLSFFSLIPWWISIVSIVFVLPSLLGIPFFSSFWISKATSQGALPIPPFRRRSLRRFFEQWWHNTFNLRGRRQSAQREENPRSNTYVGKPSVAEVFPFYQTSLMQYVSMPINSRGGTNISKSVIPQVALPSSISQEVSKYTRFGDVIYEGISAKSNEPVYRTISDINFGIAIGGDAGSGKTNALMNNFLGMSRLSRKNDGLMGKKINSNGDTITINPIWFETKSDDLSELIDYTDDYNPMVLSLHDSKENNRLALEGKRLQDDNTTIEDIKEQNNIMISAMKAIWGDSFGPQSQRVAAYSLLIAYLLDKEGLDFLEFTSRLDNPDRPNIIHLMYLLINGDASLQVNKRLKEYADSKREILTNEQRTAEFKAENGVEGIKLLKTLIISLDGLINLYDVPNAVAPLQNKLPQLLKSEGLFDTTTPTGEDRKEFDIKKLYTYGGPVIVDMTSKGSTLSENDSMIFVMMVHYLLWQSIKKNAGGWSKKGKFIPLYADEITNFTGRSSDELPCATIIGEVRDQGRSYGVSHNVGFQNFGQLPKDTKDSILSFESKIFLKFGAKADQKEVIEQISIPRFTEANVRSFPMGVGIAQLSIDKKPRSEFTIKTPYVGDWKKAISINEDINMAFESIKYDEIEMMKNEKKKKVDDKEVIKENTNNSSHDYQSMPEEDYNNDYDEDIFNLFD